MSTSDNIDGIRQRIHAAARRAGRNPEQIALMAVTKTHLPEKIREAYRAGVRVFGENRVQEFAGKAPALADLTAAAWHMIGHLQSNKAGKAVELFAAVDSVDSVKLAEKLNSAARDQHKVVRVLLEINVGGEEANSGLPPDSSELENLLLSAPRFEALQILGLMTVPPFTENAEDARPYFRRLCQIRDAIANRNIASIAMDVLSMGMSHDFEVAIEEGSTCVRVGTAIFGERIRPLSA